MSNLGVPAHQKQSFQQVNVGAVVLSAVSFMLNSFQHPLHELNVSARDNETCSA